MPNKEKFNDKINNIFQKHRDHDLYANKPTMGIDSIPYGTNWKIRFYDKSTKLSEKLPIFLTPLKWSSFKIYENKTLSNISIFYLLILPFFLSFTEILPITIEVSKLDISINIGSSFTLPFNWIYGFLLSLLFLITTVLYKFFSPRLVKQYKSLGEFKEKDFDDDQLIYEFRSYIFDKIPIKITSKSNNIYCIRCPDYRYHVVGFCIFKSIPITQETKYKIENNDVDESRLEYDSENVEPFIIPHPVLLHSLERICWQQLNQHKKMLLNSWDNFFNHSNPELEAIIDQNLPINMSLTLSLERNDFHVTKFGGNVAICAFGKLSLIPTKKSNLFWTIYRNQEISNPLMRLILSIFYILEIILSILIFSRLISLIYNHMP